MKKTVLVLAMVLICVTGMFAFDLGDFPKGTWKDDNWSAEWVFGINSIQLFDGTTGNMIFDFTQDKIQDFKLTPSTTKGLVLTFSCKETNRAYTFTKPVTLDTSIDMEIDPDWTTENYKVTMAFKR